MTREEKLSKLQSLRFCVFWPGRWEDIGFTERPIWINSFGYGYYSDDEPCSFLVIENINEDIVKEVKERLDKGILTDEWLNNTPFKSLNIFEDEEYFDSILDSFEELPDHVNGKLFCGQIFEGWLF